MSSKVDLRRNSNHK